MNSFYKVDTENFDFHLKLWAKIKNFSPLIRMFLLIMALAVTG